MGYGKGSPLASVGLLLAGLGIFSIVSFSVTRRTREFGIRIALGARSRDVLALVTTSTMKLLAAGVVLGTAGVAAVSGVIESYVEGWNPRDPVAFGAVILLLAVVTLAACWLPVRRATSIEPTSALRHE